LKDGRKNGHTAYHFHNFFDTIQKLRFKYKTYGHPVNNALTRPLGEFHEDVDLAVRCIMNRTTESLLWPAKTNVHWIKGGLHAVDGGRIPRLFQINNDDAESYYQEHHQELFKMIQSDEEEQTPKLTL